jgi:single-strand DNA-binding protein
MASDTNSITISGNITREPEMRYTPSGISKVTFGVAVNRSWRNQQTQEWDEQTSFFNVVAWRQLAENASASLAKGSRVVVSGRLEQRSWETEAGEKRSIVEIVADDIAASLRFATAEVHKVERSGPGGPGGSGGSGDGGGRQAPAPTPAAEGATTGENYDQYGEEPF